MTLRVCRPASPKSRSRRSDAPLMTVGWLEVAAGVHEADHLDHAPHPVQRADRLLHARQAVERRVARGQIGVRLADLLADHAHVPAHPVDAGGLPGGEDEVARARGGQVVADRHRRLRQLEPQRGQLLLDPHRVGHHRQILSASASMAS
jgi:hypothetical protein